MDANKHESVCSPPLIRVFRVDSRPDVFIGLGFQVSQGLRRICLTRLGCLVVVHEQIGGYGFRSQLSQQGRDLTAVIRRMVDHVDHLLP